MNLEIRVLSAANLPAAESLRVQSFVVSLCSREEPGISLSNVNRKAPFDLLARYTHSISPKCGSALNTRSNDFIRTYIEHVDVEK